MRQNSCVVMAHLQPYVIIFIVVSAWNKDLLPKVRECSQKYNQTARNMHRTVRWKQDCRFARYSRILHFIEDVHTNKIKRAAAATLLQTLHGKRNRIKRKRQPLSQLLFPVDSFSLLYKRAFQLMAHIWHNSSRYTVSMWRELSKTSIFDRWTFSAAIFDGFELLSILNVGILQLVSCWNVRSEQ